MKTITFFMVAAVLTFAAGLGGCVAPVVHNTASGRPEVIIAGQVGKEAQSEITNLMINRGYNVKSASDVMMVFEKPIENVFAAALMGSRYDSTPAARVTINIIESDASTRVVSSFAAVTNPGSAFERITPLNNHPETARFQDCLNEIKERVEARHGAATPNAR